MFLCTQNKTDNCNYFIYIDVQFKSSVVPYHLTMHNRKYWGCCLNYQYFEGGNNEFFIIINFNLLFKVKLEILQHDTNFSNWIR